MTSCLQRPKFLIEELAADISLAVSCSSNLLPELLLHASCQLSCFAEAIVSHANQNWFFDFTSVHLHIRQAFKRSLTTVSGKPLVLEKWEVVPQITLEMGIGVRSNSLTVKGGPARVPQKTCNMTCVVPRILGSLGKGESMRWESLLLLQSYLEQSKCKMVVRQWPVSEMVYDTQCREMQSDILKGEQPQHCA